MTNKFVPDLELPAEVRAIAEKNVAQARQAFESLFQSTREAVGETDEHFDEVRASVQGLRTKALGMMQANMEASFEFMQKMVAAKSPQEMMSLQAGFLSRQMQSAAEQAQALGVDAKGLGEATMRSLDEHTRTLAERVKTLSAAAAQNAQNAAQDMKTVGESMVSAAKSSAEQAAAKMQQGMKPGQN
ncbi:phasin family protein [Xanthobacter sp. TB0139]|uniref:phasin family protein n=1 Tax=Xanthobacter sp. TB0139 TaxID=3459178 RepID=UPI0040393D05